MSDEILEVENRVFVDQMLSPLKPRNRKILELFSEGVSNKEISRRLGITEGRVRRLIRESIQAIRSRDEAYEKR